MDSESDPLLLRSHVEFTQPPASSNMAKELLACLRKNATRTLLVDTQSGREWTGRAVLARTSAIAAGLIRGARLQPNDAVMCLCERNDTEAILALSVLFAGGALYPALASDGLRELEVMCELVSPRAAIVSAKHLELALRLRENVPACRAMKIIRVEERDEGQHGSRDNNNNNSESESRSSAGHLQAAEREKYLSASGGAQQNGHSNKISFDANNNEIPSDGEPLPAEDGLYSLSEILETSDCQQDDIELIETTASKSIIASEHIATYMLTSGSTGRPKVVPSTHEELVHGLYSMLSACTNPFRYEEKIRSRAGDTGDAERETYLLPLSERDVVSGDLPLDHGAGINVMFLSLMVGSKFIVMPSYNVDVFWRAVGDHGVTFSLSSTTFGYNLFKRLKELIELGDTGAYDLRSLRHIGVCGAKMAFLDLVREVTAHESFAHIRLFQAYGCTEHGFISIGLGREACVSEYLDSVGFLFPGVRAKVIDQADETRTLPAGERGELLVWSRSLFKRYIVSPSGGGQEQVDAFAACHDSAGEFYRTGDQAHVDADGRLYLHGRFKDTLVLMSDWKVMPAELEGLLNEHPLIETSVVVGKPDPELPGCHAPRAFVKLISLEAAQQQVFAPASGCSADELAHLCAKLAANELAAISQHIYDWFAARAAGPKHLRGGVRILDEFPRVGLLRKVDRKALLFMD